MKNCCALEIHLPTYGLILYDMNNMITYGTNFRITNRHCEECGKNVEESYEQKDRNYTTMPDTNKCDILFVCILKNVNLNK